MKKILFILILLILTSSFASAKSYDGIWFLGFNLHKDIFLNENGKLTRKAFSMAIDRSWIAENIINDNTVPYSIIPPGMTGYDPNIEKTMLNLSEAKKLMKQAGYPMDDKRIKKLTLLHTDGEKTKEIVKWIKRHLINIGVDLELVEIDYSNTASWEAALQSGQHHMFVMGYKSSLFTQVFIGDKEKKVFHDIQCKKLPSADSQEFFGNYDEAIAQDYRPCAFCKPEKNDEIDTVSLLYPLFYSTGSANLTFYKNSRVDILFDQISLLAPALKSDRKAKIKEISGILAEDRPILPIFYITRL